MKCKIPMTKDLKTVNKESRDIWNQNAPFWDEYMGDEGNHYYKLLTCPATERLLQLQPDALVLEIACGNGNFARHIAQLGGRVIATDFSEEMVEIAKGRTTEYVDRIEYQVIDATDENQLLALGDRRFDAAVCMQGLMDMPTIEPLVSALSRRLKVGGRFVFTVPHPCFNSSKTARVAEEEERDGEIVQTYAVKVSEYIEPKTFKGLGIIGQPEPQYYFHRPMSELFNAFFGAGFVLDGVEEPTFPPGTEATRAFSRAKFWRIPPVLVARMRLR